MVSTKTSYSAIASVFKTFPCILGLSISPVPCNQPGLIKKKMQDYMPAGNFSVISFHTGTSVWKLMTLPLITPSLTPHQFITFYCHQYVPCYARLRSACMPALHEGSQIAGESFTSQYYMQTSTILNQQVIGPQELVHGHIGRIL